MRAPRTPLEEAHPPVKRASDTAFGLALIAACKKAAAKGMLKLSLPDYIAKELVRQRHDFYEDKPPSPHREAFEKRAAEILSREFNTQDPNYKGDKK